MTTRWEVERAVLGSDLPAAARLVALALLTFTDGGGVVVSRQHGPSLSALAQATGLDRRTVMRQLDVLETGGWVKRDRPDPAAARARGARTGYALCPVVARGTTPPARGTEPLPVGAPRPQGRGTTPPEVGAPVREGRGTMPPSPESQKLQKQQPRAKLTPEGVIIAATGCTHEEAQAVVRLIIDERKPNSPIGLVRRIATDGELPDWLERIRAGIERTDIVAFVASLATLPECDHGQPGGDQLRPDNGQPQCALCRARRRAAA